MKENQSCPLQGNLGGVRQHVGQLTRCKRI